MATTDSGGKARFRTLWYLTTANGDYPWTPGRLYPPDFEHYKELAQAIDDGGFYGALVATWPNDPFTSASFAAAVSSRMRFLVATYSGVVPPKAFAEKALTFDRFSGGRLDINVINGTDDRVGPYGVKADHDDRYTRSTEYWAEVLEHYRAGTDSNFHNSPVRIDPTQDVLDLWGTGDSPAGLTHAGASIHNYLTMLRPAPELAPRIEAAQSAVAAAGREFDSIGALGGVIVRPSADEALEKFYTVFTGAGVDAVRDTLDVAVKKRTNGEHSLLTYTAPDAQRQGWVDALRANRFPEPSELQVDEGLYAGITAWSPLDIFGSRSSALYFVGDPDSITGTVRRLKDAVGISSLILAGWPLAEEARQVAEHLIPRFDEL
ncbi:LLM class flavin-dependent oxidoreductase [Nocardia sp. 348MFTsu5.1]|uniref:LLM class flavin-dependent oxidoreductase n=1 Tax=Nocardia sp. 348MFTsu5.1 TaxID=1172185 RepID=UPI000380297A|nr:LLM class flavin-dependent oxidoreductase [Nocardia sp. 348MFTsu5.1]